ncbi:related to PRE7-20S proteasome subunit(beta6) [Armillaria ostoyae]|uniref:Proteasome subunit beta n=1 Tax=Armillaria ostoyae TaxID=47428 RepID=A0A284RED7_ARMOS|nr:related to PRE7-20S proteasome subunit(beta6) [Armillaria ostoyae]
MPVAQPQERQFNPYSDNGGTILAVAGADFSVIAGDTRQSEGYSIQTRYAPKVFRLTDKAVLAVNGFAADGNMFVKKVKQRLEWYRHAHSKDMPLRAVARLIQSMLYARRFFPYYVYNILGGIEEDGSGAVYSFDPVGSYEREACRAAGAASSLVQPFLDNQPQDPVNTSNFTSLSLSMHPSGHTPISSRLIPSFLVDMPLEMHLVLDTLIMCLSLIYFKNQTPAPGTSHPAHLPLTDVLALVIDSFTSATERHIEVGDGLEMYVVLAKGSPLQGLELVQGVQEMSSTTDGERVFIVRRNLKRD